MNVNQEISDSQQYDAPAKRPRSQRTTVLVIIAVVISGGAYQSYRWFTTPRASVDRQIIQTMLRGVAQAYINYTGSYGQLPTFEILARRGDLSSDQIKMLAPVAYKTDKTPTSPRLVVVQKAPCRAVAKGEPWGGPGEVTDRELPPQRYALFDDMRVRGIEEEEFQSRFMPHVEIIAYP